MSMVQMRRGFTLMEVMVVIAIMGIVTAAIAPMLMRRRSAEQERNEVVAELNQLMQSAWQEALFSERIIKVEFDVLRQKVALFKATGRKDIMGDPEFEPVDDSYIKPSIPWPPDYLIKEFFIDGRLQSGQEVIWFFIMPGGLSQRVIINAIDQKASEQAGEPVQFSLVLNPFYVQFKEFTTFQRP